MAHPLIDALPGFPVKISAVLPSLDKAWADEGENAARASQMNLVLMFGAGVTPADAQARFDEAIRFAQRYPCRLVVLAARPAAEAAAALEAKVNVLCFFDPSRRGKRCCEALMLAHGAPTPELESLVSTWLEGDLPTNVWAHGVTVDEFKPWLNWTARCRRVVADLDAQAEILADELRLANPDLYGAIIERLRVKHQLSIRILPFDVMPDNLRRLDLHARQLQLSELLDPASRTFAAAFQLAMLEAKSEIDALVAGASRRRRCGLGRYQCRPR